MRDMPRVGMRVPLASRDPQAHVVLYDKKISYIVMAAVIFLAMPQ
jgi:hypothetical protein